ncbi:hypothetical protein SAY87_010833 [Trapa incisa]|uniref:Uncharacterized protein n=1 Tax=Trapa incisa TaxID=236973 RepID=A0AAN7GF77_9MYRT|nr:hypothetical protein SAY87_010833 [Trapa incisa]
MLAVRRRSLPPLLLRTAGGGGCLLLDTWIKQRLGAAVGRSGAAAGRCWLPDDTKRSRDADQCWSSTRRLLLTRRVREMEMWLQKKNNGP